VDLERETKLWMGLDSREKTDKSEPADEADPDLTAAHGLLQVSGGLRRVKKLMTTAARNTKNRTWAIVAAEPARLPNPKKAAISASTRNINDH
jgi:hypothetical protein